MNIHTKLQNLFKKTPHPNSSRYIIREETLAKIHHIAEQDKALPGTVLNNLLDYALQQRQLADDSLAKWHLLTQREREVTALVWLGLTNAQIAERLTISKFTVRSHNRNILAKFTVNSKEALRAVLDTLDFSEWAYLWLDEADSTNNSVPPNNDTQYSSPKD